MERFCRDKRGARMYLREWLDFFEVKQNVVAGKAEIVDTYVSAMLSGSKVVASLHFVAAMAEELRITIDDLYLPPPDGNVASFQRLSEKAKQTIMSPPAAKQRRSGPRSPRHRQA